MAIVSQSERRVAVAHCRSCRPFVRVFQRASLAILVVTLEAACAFAETPGDLFRRQMAELKTYCDNRRLRPGETTCQILSLKAADPSATPAGQLAHSIKLPPTVPPRTYRFGVTSDRYFKELCQEAGEFIFATVKDVEGVMQLRPRSMASHAMLQHLFAMEDPYGYRDWEADHPEGFYVKPNRYRFFERPLESERRGGPVTRYYGYDGRDPQTMKKEIAATPQSRYGFTWRGISRPNDREMGIAGGEFIIVDIQTLEVLGVKRGFARTGEADALPRRIWWRSRTVCPGDSNDIYALATFVTKVLIPSQH